MINSNENEAKNKKADHIDMTYIDRGLDIDTNILNIKCVLV